MKPLTQTTFPFKGLSYWDFESLALPLGEERYTPTDGAEIVSGDQPDLCAAKGRRF